MTLRAVLVGLSGLTLAACAPEAADGDAQTVETTVDPRPVRVGLSGPDLDACAGYGEVRGVPEDGQPVLAAPSSDAQEIGRLANGQGVSICEMAGGWVGVVYAPAEGDRSDCETGSPVPQEQDYDGPCPSGWVRDGAIEFLAG